jgi:hypothetical protein
LHSAPSFALETAAITNDAQLCDCIDREIESSALFRRIGLQRFVDDPVFSWYLDSDPSRLAAILAPVRELLRALGSYDLTQSFGPRDILRDFYHGLVPETLRKSLGEFYTPDWLVDYTLDQLGTTDWTKLRLLDPSCGSGSFLLESLRRKRLNARVEQLSPAEELRMLVGTIEGGDLNPLAVTFARTNFLLSIVDLLPKVQIPQIRVPISLTDALSETSAPASFDLVVGNPPWVKWSKLPEEYRKRVQPLCRSYDIFSSNQRYGGSELDISGMILFRVADCQLKQGGKLAFVITQSHFQAPSSEGIRKFRLGDNCYLCPLQVDDLKALRPFPDAANKTVVAVFEKRDQEPSYPVPYRLWQTSHGASRSLPPELGKEDILRRVSFEVKEASPVGNPGSPWAVLDQGRLSHVSMLAGRSDWVHGRKGITADLNGIFFVPIVDQNVEQGLVQIVTRPEAGRVDIGESKSYWVEPELIFPLLKGASDFDACFVEPKHQLYVIVPNQGITQAAYDQSLADLQQRYPNMFKYFERYEENLKARSTYRTRMPGAPFFAVYNVGGYSFAPYKVVWAEQRGSFRAAVARQGRVPLVGERPIVPDHKVFFVEFEDESLAYYLCGLLNAPIVREYVDAHVVPTQVGDVFKHMSLPRYDERNEKHRAIVGATRAAHEQPEASKRSELVQKVKEMGEGILKA